MPDIINTNETSQEANENRQAGVSGQADADARSIKTEDPSFIRVYEHHICEALLGYTC